MSFAYRRDNIEKSSRSMSRAAFFVVAMCRYIFREGVDGGLAVFGKVRVITGRRAHSL